MLSEFVPGVLVVESGEEKPMLPSSKLPSVGM